VESIPPVVSDTNILFSVLLGGDSLFSYILLRREPPIYVCENILVELFKRKDKIISCSRLSEDEVLRAYHIVLRHINLFKESLIPSSCWKEAQTLCHDIDPTDTPHVALTLAIDGRLWTGDKQLREGLKRKGFDRFFFPGKIDEK
jgi:predicted nucleic acid-binding protein